MGFRLKKSLLLYQSKNEGYKNKEVAICAIKKSYINFGPKKNGWISSDSKISSRINKLDSCSTFFIKTIKNRLLMHL